MQFSIFFRGVDDKGDQNGHMWVLKMTQNILNVDSNGIIFANARESYAFFLNQDKSENHFQSYSYDLANPKKII